MRADDADEARCETALRGHQAARVGGEPTDVLRGRHILGEVEIMQAERMGDARDALVERVRQTGQHGVLSLERGTQGSRISDLERPHGEGRDDPGAIVEGGDLETRSVQKLRSEVSDLAETEHRHF